jgi:hypothetical protein
MPAGGFTIGRDVSIIINMPQGPVKFSNLTGFKRQQITTGIESKGLDGVDRFADIPSGWQGSIDIDRENNALDLAFAFLENLYYSGQNVPSSTISETTTEVNGSVTQFRYVGVSFKFDNAGDAAGDAKVSQTVSWKASRRKLVSSGQ